MVLEFPKILADYATLFPWEKEPSLCTAHGHILIRTIAYAGGDILIHSRLHLLRLRRQRRLRLGGSGCLNRFHVHSQGEIRIHMVFYGGRRIYRHPYTLDGEAVKK